MSLWYAFERKTVRFMTKFPF